MTIYQIVPADLTCVICQQLVRSPDQHNTFCMELSNSELSPTTISQLGALENKMHVFKSYVESSQPLVTCYCTLSFTNFKQGICMACMATQLRVLKDFIESNLT